jgi:branched-subunit amino acid transport protein AzlD
MNKIQRVGKQISMIVMMMMIIIILVIVIMLRVLPLGCISSRSTDPDYVRLVFGNVRFIKSLPLRTYSLHGAVLLEKLTGLQLVIKFPAFYETRRFITALTCARHLSLY